jgi:hypothetical protein
VQRLDWKSECRVLSARDRREVRHASCSANWERGTCNSGATPRAPSSPNRERGPVTPMPEPRPLYCAGDLRSPSVAERAPLHERT